MYCLCFSIKMFHFHYYEYECKDIKARSYIENLDVNHNFIGIMIIALFIFF